MLSIFTLGGLRFSKDEAVLITNGSQKAEALFVYLLIEGRPAQREVLATLLWPESSQAKAFTSLRVALSKLRKYFSDYMIISRETVEVKSDESIFIDIKEIERKLAEGKILSALPLIKGDFLEGFHVADSEIFENWRNIECHRIRALLLDGLKRAASISIQTNDVTTGFQLVQQILKIDPFNEEAHRQYMYLSVLNGDKNGALDHFDEYVLVLKEELGVEPSIESQVLFQKIQNNEGQGIFDDIKIENNLPVYRLSFIGRHTELYNINKMIHQRDVHVITITGPGGSGKTRLAIEAARLTITNFPDGIFFVPLEDTPDAAFIIPAIAKALHFNIDTIATQMDPEDQLIDFLGHRKVLLVLDGVDALYSHSEVISNLVNKMPEVKLVMTSRQPMNISGEWIVQIDGLCTENINDRHGIQAIDSVKLFVDRGKQINPNLVPSPTDLQKIKEICELIEGIPLAIEMAAAWTSMLSIDEIHIEISRNLDFLISRYKDTPEGHRSLRAVFESSWRLLTNKQQEKLSKLAIFRGDFDRKAALIISNLTIEDLYELSEKSLIQRSEEGRFNLHQLIRQYVVEKLIKKTELFSELQRRYSIFYIDLLNNSREELMGSQMLETRAKLRKEIHHIFESIQWITLNFEDSIGLQALNSFIVFLSVHGWHEGLDMLRIIEKERIKSIVDNGLISPLDDPIVINCRVHQGFLLSNLGQIAESEEISRSCAEKLAYESLPIERSVCLHNLGVNASFQGEFLTAKQLLEEAIILGKECGYVLWPTYLLWLGHANFLLGEYEQGLIVLKKCRDIFLAKGTLWGAAFALSKMGLAADGLGEHLQALGYHQEAFSVFEKIKNEAGKGYALSRMGMSAYFLKEYEIALKYSTQACEIFEKLSHRWGLSSSLSRAGFAQLGLGSINLALPLFIKALEISRDNQMAPLSLYALGGLVCIQFSKGLNIPAFDLLSYLRHHPKMVKAYLEQAIIWIEERKVDLSTLGSQSEYPNLSQMTLSEVVTHCLVVFRRNLPQT